MNQQDRRTFVKNSILGSTLALGITSQVLAEKKAMLPIVDTHQHLWDVKQFKLPWVEVGAPLARNFVLKDYQRKRYALQFRDISKDPLYEFNADIAKEIYRFETHTDRETSGINEGIKNIQRLFGVYNKLRKKI